MAELIIKKKCDWCQGTGLIKNKEGENITCTSCAGSGKEALHTIDITDLVDKVDDCLGKLADLKEKVDETKEVCDKILKIVGKL